MTTDAEKHAAALNIAEVLEAVDNAVRMTSAFQILRFQDLTPELWASIQTIQDMNRELFETFRQIIVAGTAILNDDACLDHVQAVMLPHM